MKKRLCTLLLALALCYGLLPAASAAESTTVVLKIGCNQMAVNDTVTAVDDLNAAVCPIAENNRTLVPVSRIVAAFGGESTWEASTNATTYTLNGKTVFHTIGTNTVTTPNGKKTMEVPSKAMNNRTYVPARYILEGLGLKVEYEPTNQLVVVSTGSLNGKELLNHSTSKALLGALDGQGRAPVSAAGAEPTVEELQKACNLGLTLSHDPAEPDSPISFGEYKTMLDKLVELCDPAALPAWNASVSAGAFPKRDPRRDDGLVLLLMAARVLGYDVYNARDYIICTEYQVDYDQMDRQMSWDYPYCDMDQPILLYHEPGVPDDPLDNVPSAITYWMQRRMDLSQWKHFLDHDGTLNFHLDQSLTWKAAAAAALRLYNSEKLDILDYKPVPREPTEADRVMLAKAEAKKQEILGSTGGRECTGTAYYVSNSGSDRNNGKSPQTAWATLDKVNDAPLRPGDGVYFQRGGLWRGQLWAQEGVTYSAYGEGEKPRLYASPENGAGGEKWTLLEGTDNIWVYYAPMMDCGGVVFNEGERYGAKACPWYVDGFRSAEDPSKPFDVKAELTEDLDFFSRADSILIDGAPIRMYGPDRAKTVEHRRYKDIPYPVGELYLRCDAGNPGEVFDSIEFAIGQHLVQAADQTAFDNLSLKYCGAHAIYGYNSDFDVTNCEIGWIGGTIQYYFFDTGAPVRFGNGVEAGGCFDRFSVTDCYLYHCWDAGVTNQDSADTPEMTGMDTLQYEDAIHRNVTYARNVIEHTAMPVEIFFNLDDNAGYGRHYMENVLIADNYILYTGYGWSLTDPVNSILTNHAAYMGHPCPNTATNFRIENNVFYLSTGPLIFTWAKWDSLPVLSGNTYAQSENCPLVSWTSGDAQGAEREGTFYWYREDTALDIIHNVLGDKTGVLLKSKAAEPAPAPGGSLPPDSGASSEAGKPSGEVVSNTLTVGDMPLCEFYRDDGLAKPLVILLHSGGGSKEETIPWAEDLAHQGFYALAVDAAAHGDSKLGPMDIIMCWATTVTQLDGVIEHYMKVPQADAEHFGLAGSSMGGTTCFAYVAHGKYRPAVIAPSVGSADLTALPEDTLHGRAGEGEPEEPGMTPEEVLAYAKEYSPSNFPERFLDVYIYSQTGMEDPIGNPASVKPLEDALGKLGGTKFVFEYYEGVGHEGSPDFDPNRALRQVLLGDRNDPVFAR